MSATGRSRKPKTDVIVIDEDESSSVQPSEASVKVEEVENVEEPAPQTPPPVTVDDLQKQLEKMTRQYERACKWAGQAEKRAEYAEGLLETKRGLVESGKTLLETELEEKVADLTRQVEASRKRADNAFTARTEAVRERDAMKEQLAEIKISTEKQIRELKEKYAGLDEKESDLARENGKLKDELDKANCMKDELALKNSTIRDELKEANSTKVEFAREIASLKRDLEDANSKTNDLGSDSNLETELEEARRREQEAIREKDDLAVANAKLNEEICDLLKRTSNSGIQIDELIRENAQLQQEIERSANDGNHNDELIRENAVLKEQIDNYKRADGECNNAELIHENAVLKQEVDKERRRADEAVAQKNETAVDNDLLKMDLKDMKEKMENNGRESELSRENARLSAELDRMVRREREDGDNHSELVRQRNAAKKDVDRLSKKVDDLKRQLDEELAQADHQKATLTARIADLKAQLQHKTISQPVYKPMDGVIVIDESADERAEKRRSKGDGDSPHIKKKKKKRSRSREEKGDGLSPHGEKKKKKEKRESIEQVIEPSPPIEKHKTREVTGRREGVQPLQHLQQPLQQQKLQQQPEQQSTPLPWPMVSIVPADPSTMDLAQIGDLTNLFHLVQPGSRDAISGKNAAIHLRAALTKATEKDANFVGRDFVPTHGVEADCTVCDKHVENMEMLDHFLGKEHQEKIFLRGAAVSLPALMHWVRKLSQ